MKTLNTLLSELSYGDLDQWAGEKINSRGKTYIKQVDGLCRTGQGELAAWVSGAEEYATLVRLDEEGDHDWFCTCPYDGSPCKHAVAVMWSLSIRRCARVRSGPWESIKPWPRPIPRLRSLSGGGWSMV